MQVVQFLKELNNTELGKGGTHETYILVPRQADVSDIFERKNEPIAFVQKGTKKIYRIRLTVGREKRIVGLGAFYRENALCAGDTVLLEKRRLGDSVQYFIDVNKRTDVIVLQKSPQGFEVLNAERLSLLENGMPLVYQNECAELGVRLLSTQKKRKDSPEETRYYGITVGDRELLTENGTDGLTEIVITDGKAELKPFCKWKKYSFVTEDSV